MATATVGALRVVLGLDSATFTEGLTAAQKHLRGVGRQMQTVGTNMAQIGAGITAAVTAPIAALGITFTKAAIDAQEMQSAFDVSFGKMSKSTREWAEETGDAMGRSTFELQKMALGFNGLFKTGGPVTEQTVEMSKRFTQLAQDLSSFHNVSEQDAFAALRSGLSGEAEPLRQFNVYLTEASVQAEAMRLGLAKAGEEVSEQAKIQARASLIMKGTTEAQGDVIRTSAGTQNQIRALKSQWAELSVTLGTAILPVLTPIVSKLNEMAKSFSGLSPAMQSSILVFAGLAAVVGPVLIALGALVSAVGTLSTAFAGAGFVAAFAAAAPIIGAVAVAVGVAVAAFLAFKDDVTPALSQFWGVVQKTLGPALQQLFSAVGELVGSLVSLFKTAFQNEAVRGLVQFQLAVASILGGTVVNILSALVKIVTVAVRAISDGFKVLGLLLKGDFVGAWSAYAAGTQRAIEGLKGVLGGLASFAIDAVRRMVQGVSQWLTGKLFDVLNGTINRVKSVSDAFFKLYDAVVGHSYVPDMVTEIGEWMSKLDGNMVAPAQKAAQTTAEAFEQAQERASAALETLLTDSERAWRDHQNTIRALQDGVDAGGPGADVYRQGIARANAGYVGRDLRMPDVPRLAGGVSDMPGVQAINDAMGRINAEIDASRERFADAFSYGIEAALRGDWSSILRMVVGDTFNDALRGMGRSIFNGSGGGSGGILSTIGRSIGGLFGKLPGFATGGSFKVGGAGGIDSKLVAFRATPGEMVNIRRPGQDMARGPMQVEVTPSKYFDVRVRSAAQPMVAQGGVQAVQASRKIVPAEQGRKQRYSFS